MPRSLTGSPVLRRPARQPSPTKAPALCRALGFSRIGSRTALAADATHRPAEGPAHQPTSGGSRARPDGRPHQATREGAEGAACLTLRSNPRWFASASRAFTRRDGYAQSAVIVGAGDVGQLVARKLLRHPEYGVKLVGFVDSPPKRWRPDVAGVPVLGAIEDLASIVNERAVERVIVAFSTHNDQETLTRLRPLVGLNVRVDVVTRMFEMVGPGARLLSVEGIPLVSMRPRRRSALSLRVKRAIDVVGASVALMIAAPLFLWAWWRIPRESPGPLFYRQTRLGENMQEFTMLKFRTMTADTEQSPHQAYVARVMNGQQTAGPRRALQARPPGIDHPDRTLAAEDEPRRAAPTHQCPAGQDVAGGPAAVLGLRNGVLRRAPLRALSHSPRHHRPLAGHGACTCRLPRGARDGRRVRS